MRNKVALGSSRVRGANGFEQLLGILTRRGPLIVFGLLLAGLALRAPSLLSVSSIQSTLVQASPIAIVAFGLAIVVIGGGDDAVVGGIDLSIPASAALATAIISDQLTNRGSGIFQALMLGIAAAMIVGLVNALLITVIGLTPILATLATFASIAGIIKVLTTNRRINVDHPAVLWIRDESIAGVSPAVWIMLVTFAVLWFVVHRTGYGMRIQTVGGNVDAAVNVGLNPKRYAASTFVLASVAAGVAGLLLVARGSGMSAGIEDRLLVDMVLATFVGAAFSSRNVVTIPGALMGAVLVAFMSNGLLLNQVNNSWVDGWKGTLVLVVVIAAALQTRRAKQ